MLFRELAEISYDKYCASDDVAYCNHLRELHIDRSSLILFASSRLSQRTLDLLAYELLSGLYENPDIKDLANYLDRELKLQSLSTTNKIALLTAYHSIQETMAITPFYLQRGVKVEDIVKEVTISKIMLGFNKAIILLSNDEPFPEDDIEYQIAERLAYQVATSVMQPLAYTDDLNNLQQLCVLFSLSIVQANSLLPSLLRAQELSKVLLITEGLSKIQLVVQDEPKHSECFIATAIFYLASSAINMCNFGYNIIKICFETLRDVVDNYILSPVVSFAQGIVR